MNGLRTLCTANDALLMLDEIQTGNGRTGEVKGERPYSAWKIGFAVLAGLVLAAAVGYAIALSEQGRF